MAREQGLAAVPQESGVALDAGALCYITKFTNTFRKFLLPAEKKFPQNSAGISRGNSEKKVLSSKSIAKFRKKGSALGPGKKNKQW